MSRQEIERQFAQMTRWYGCFLRDWLPPDRDALVLDIPCGHGNLLYFLKQAGYRQVRGYDLEPERVAVAHELGLPAEQGDAWEVLREQRGAALVACLDFLEHLDPGRVPEFLALCREALRPGGRFVARLPFTDSILGAHDLFNDVTHKWAANSSVVLELVQQAGFESVEIRDERPVPYKLVNWGRLAAFHVCKAATNLWLMGLGLGPRQVWSTSGWVSGERGR
jgi:SAM-dependent methyltransferase